MRWYLAPRLILPLVCEAHVTISPMVAFFWFGGFISKSGRFNPRPTGVVGCWKGITKECLGPFQILASKDAALREQLRAGLAGVDRLFEASIGSYQ